MKDKVDAFLGAMGGGQTTGTVQTAEFRMNCMRLQEEKTAQMPVRRQQLRQQQIPAGQALQMFLICMIL